MRWTGRLPALPALPALPESAIAIGVLPAPGEPACTCRTGARAPAIALRVLTLAAPGDDVHLSTQVCDRWMLRASLHRWRPGHLGGRPPRGHGSVAATTGRTQTTACDQTISRAARTAPGLPRSRTPGPGPAPAVGAGPDDRATRASSGRCGWRPRCRSWATNSLALLWRCWSTTERVRRCGPR